MRALVLFLSLILAFPVAAQDKKAEKKKPATKTVTKKSDSTVAPAKAKASVSPAKAGAQKKAATKKTVEPTQDWGRFNTASKKDLEKIEKDKAAKK